MTPTAAAEPTETAEEPAAEEPAAEEPAADEGSASGDVCERARSCCTDYVAAMPSSAAVNADTACAGVAQLNGPASAAACQAAIDGWRQGLTAMNADIPSSCAE